MRYPPSTVNVARLPQAHVPDNSQQNQLIQQIGARVKTGLDQRKAARLRDELLTPEQKQAALAQESIDIREEQAHAQVEQKAAQDREVIRQQSRYQEIMSDPDQKAKFMELHQLDPQMAGSLMSVLVSEDEAMKAQVAQQAAEANRFFVNYGRLIASDGKDVADKYLRETARQIVQNGGDVSKMAPLLTQSPDEAIASAKVQAGLTGTVYNMPEVRKAVILSEGAQMRTPEGKLIAENVKDSRSDALQAQNVNLRREELELQRDKFNRDASKMSAAAEKQLFTAQDAAETSRVQASELENVADAFDQASMDAGFTARTGEAMKQFFGSEDAETNLRKQFNRIVTKEAIGNLPPGVASDKDVELVLAGYLKDTANPKTAASFLRGMAKLQRANQKYQTFKADWLSENGNSRGMQKAWREELKAQQASDPLGLRNP